MIREFLYPEAFQLAHFQHPDQGSSFPVSPTTPTSFTTQLLGVELELDIEPVGGLLIMGGKLNHRIATYFDVMTGEAFSPITTTATDPDGQSTELILSNNQVLQPRFAISESPFVVSASAGTPVKIPVQTTFGATFLEITCRQVP